MFSKSINQHYVTKVNRGDGFVYARIMKGILSEHIVIDLKAFTLTELEVVLRNTILPEIDETLNVYRGGNHIRVFRDANKSASEDLLFIGDSPIIIDDEPLRVDG